MDSPIKLGFDEINRVTMFDYLEYDCGGPWSVHAPGKCM